MAFSMRLNWQEWNHGIDPAWMTRRVMGECSYRKGNSIVDRERRLVGAVIGYLRYVFEIDIAWNKSFKEIERYHDRGIKMVDSHDVPWRHETLPEMYNNILIGRTPWSFGEIKYHMATWYARLTENRGMEKVYWETAGDLYEPDVPVSDCGTRYMARTILKEQTFGEVSVLADRLLEQGVTEHNGMVRHLQGWRRCWCNTVSNYPPAGTCGKCNDGWLKKEPCRSGCWALHRLARFERRLLR